MTERGTALAPQRFASLWGSLLPIGRDPAGGYLRSAWSPADLACRDWFVEAALQRDLTVEADGNGNLWAWWDPRRGSSRGYTHSPSRADAHGPRAVVTGSHLDSVPHGGAYDGALGVVSALLAVDLLRERAVVPQRPVGIAVFAEEEGARFGMPCLGSRLFTGALPAERARRLTDSDGVTLAEAMTWAGADPARLGPDPDRLARIGAFVELHIEQGRALSAPIGVASAIWPHGRWRLDFSGAANHAGTTPMPERRDPMVTCADTVLAANSEARRRDALATVGRITVEPNAPNAIPSRVSAWLDARAARDEDLAALVEAITGRAAERASRDGTAVTVTAESATPRVEFHAGLRERILRRLDHPSILPTGAGHDAGVLAAQVPTAMLFVRNPTGISHAPEEHATDTDCAAGVTALADVLQDLSCTP